MGPESDRYARTGPSAISADRIFDGQRWHDNALIVIDRGMVQCIAPRRQSAGEWPIDVMPPGTLLAPGFIDLQVNGGGGVLLNDDPTLDAMRAIARAHRKYGTTSCLPTLISDTRAKATAANASCCARFVLRNGSFAESFAPSAAKSAKTNCRYILPNCFHMFAWKVVRPANTFFGPSI